MLIGQPPFVRDQPLAVLAAHLSQQPPPVSAGGLPPTLDGVFGRALAKSPDERYRSCGEFGDALRAAAGLAACDSGGPRRSPAHPAGMAQARR